MTRFPATAARAYPRSRSRFLVILVALLAVSVLTTGLLAQPRQKEKPGGRRQDLVEQFHKLSPEQRLNQVVRTVGLKKAFVPVVRKDLDLTIVERGSIESADALDIVSKVKGTASIKWLIEDGTAVKAGERVVELDDSGIREQLRAQEVAVEQAQKTRLAAEKNLQATRKENALTVRSAEIQVELARLEQKKEDGKDATSKEILKLKVEQAQVALEKAKLRGETAAAKANARLKTQASAEQQEVKRKQAIEAQLAECTIKAPRGGIVVYFVAESARFGTPAPILAMGEPVREGQKMLRIVGLERFTVQTRIHEASIHRVRVGQTAQVRVDAFPDQLFKGKVKEVSTTASRSDWLTRDIKVYPVVVELAGPLPGLKPGMSAEIRLEVGGLTDVLQVPLESVALIGRQPYCYVVVGKELQERKVTVGARGALHVEIKEGLKEGEEVLRAPGR